MNRLLTTAAVLAWLSLPPVLLRLRAVLRGTSLSGLWRLAVLLWIAWGGAGLSSFSADVPAGSDDLAWYAVAIGMLVPPIAVLGARRPIQRVWPWFVLLPLVLVFAWPALSAMAGGRLPPRWNVEEPLIVAYCLVLVMGAGNYLGLRHTLPALLWIAGAALLAFPLCPATAGWLPTAEQGRALSTVLVAGAAWLPRLMSKASPQPLATSPTASFDALWGDFRDLFGIVWARRVQERFNDGVRRKGLSARLGMQGLEIPDGRGLASPQAVAAEIEASEESLRWLLQKFVDPGWIGARSDRIALAAAGTRREVPSEP